MNELTTQFIQEDLMAGRQPNPEVVEKMEDLTYRLNVLKQILTKRFMTSRIQMDDMAQLGALDNAIIVRIQEVMKPKDLQVRHQLYVDLCFNQNMIEEALAALKQPAEV